MISKYTTDRVKQQTPFIKMTALAILLIAPTSHGAAVEIDDSWFDEIKETWTSLVNYFLAEDDAQSIEAHPTAKATETLPQHPSTIQQYIQDNVANSIQQTLDSEGDSLFVENVLKRDLVSCLLQLDPPAAGHSPLRTQLDSAPLLDHTAITEQQECPTPVALAGNPSIAPSLANPSLTNLSMANLSLTNHSLPNRSLTHHSSTNRSPRNEVSSAHRLSEPTPLTNQLAYAAPGVTRLQPIKAQEEYYELSNPSAAENAGEGYIPAVKARQNRAASNRIWVTRFNVINVTEHPDLGITQAALDALTDQALQTKLSTKDRQLYGYHPEEMREIENFFSQLIGVQANAKVSSKEIHRLVDIVNKHKELRGYTVGEIEQVADSVTQFYRSKGLLLATAYVPVQDVSKGVVNITVLEGKLGDVVVSGNHRYKTKRLKKTFNSQIGNVVMASDIEESLYLLNDLPGLEVSGVFSSGNNVGDTLLNLHIKKEDPWAGSFRLDNDGSESTGENRGFGVLEWYNPSKNGDTFKVGVLQTQSPNNSTYGLIEYKTTLFSPKTYLSSYINSNDYTVDLGSVDVEGTVVSAGAAMEYQFTRSRARNTRLKLELARKRSVTQYSNDALNDVQNSVGNIPGKEIVRTANLSLYKDRLFEQSRVILQGRINASYGTVDGKIGLNQKDQFSKLSLDSYTMAYFNPFNSDQAHRLLFRLHGQYSDAGLPAVEQMVLGGANAVRSFSVSNFSADRAALAIVEWVYPLPKAWANKGIGQQTWSDVLQWYTFIDSGYGSKERVTSAADEIDWASLSSVGIGLQYNIAKTLTGRLDIAKTISDKNSYGQVFDDDVRAYFDMTYHF